MSIYISDELFFYCLIFVVLIGAILGSFLNCIAYRIAHNESFIKGRSRCPKCGHTLEVMDLIPILSWLFQRGKCRYCKEPISIRYPLTELFMSIMSLLCLLCCDLTPLLIRNYILLCCLFTLSLIDLEIFEIPNCCIIIPIVFWFIFVYFTQDNILEHICAAFLYSASVFVVSLIMDKLLGKESMGGGDIKLLFVMGLYLGIIGGMVGLFLSCIFGIIFALLASKDEEQRFPFGPALSISFWFVLLYGQPIIDLYKCLLLF